jgi:hypothetical protein
MACPRTGSTEAISSGLALPAFGAVSEMKEAEASPKTELFGPKLPINITHVMQMHNRPAISKNGYPESPEEAEAIASSQYRITQIILNNPNYIVVSEGAYEDLNSQSPTLMKDIIAQTIFPKGIPDQFLELTNSQKDFLKENGAANTLYYLGELSHVYRSTDADSEKRDAKLIEENFANILSAAVGESRETRALNWAKSAAEKSKNNNVLLIYGSSHDFEDRIIKLNDKTFCYKGDYNTEVDDDFKAVPGTVLTP